MDWRANDQGGFSADAGNGVTLSAMPVDLARGFTPKPKRGTKWRACVWHYNPTTRTGRRVGRDVYMTQLATADEAKRLAETVFNEN